MRYMVHRDGVILRHGDCRPEDMPLQARDGEIVSEVPANAPIDDRLQIVCPIRGLREKQGIREDLRRLEDAQAAAARQAPAVTKAHRTRLLAELRSPGGVESLLRRAIEAGLLDGISDPPPRE